LSAACNTSSAGFALSAAIDVTPIDSAKADPAPSLSASDFNPSPSEPALKKAPLSPIAWWNSARDNGDAISALTANDPADSPKIVTFLGSPPNAAMFFCTH
jgi:hypothetical protein